MFAIIDALKTGIRFQKFVMDAWFKALVAISKPVSCRHGECNVRVPCEKAFAGDIFNISVLLASRANTK